MGIGDIFKISEFKAEINKLRQENNNLSNLNQQLTNATSNMRNQLSELGAFDYYKVKEMTKQLEAEYSSKERELQRQHSERKILLESELKEKTSAIKQHCNELSQTEIELNNKITERSSELLKLVKQVKTQTNKLARSKELVKSIEYTLKKYIDYEPSQSAFKLRPEDISDLDEISPSVILKLHCMDIKDLRKAYRENDKLINSVLDKYSARYTTKANQAIYKLMVIALRAELQNILYNLKFPLQCTS